MSSRHVGSTVPAPQMPGFVRAALAAKKLTDAYRARPKYQQQDYLTWINSAPLADAKKARLAEMLVELEAGNVFRGTPWAPPAKP
ncbi:MAG: YdeI/OmpD-associated family protein [Kofleriaceae bacterium]